MRKLDFPPNFDADAKFTWLRAFMLFYDDFEYLKAYFARNVILRELGPDPSQDFTICADFIRIFALGPGNPEIQSQAKRRYKDGVTAGLVLALIYIMDWAKQEKPSVNKACHILMEEADRRKREGAEIRHHAERKAIYAAWNNMRSVAHYWAAYELGLAMEPLPKIHNEAYISVSAPGGMDWLNLYFLVSAKLRQFGCSHFPHNTKKPETILCHEKSIALPDEFEIQAIESCNLNIPKYFEQGIINLLKDYKAPKII